jgi:5'-nucleotidase (lipoprotein e(P4) family)
MKKILFFSTVILFACKPTLVTTSNDSGSSSIPVNGKLFATVFQQKAAEYKALCLQAFNIAQLRLDQYKPTTNKPRAIITDIDETILDNSAFEAHQTLQGKDFEPNAWYEWTDKAAADTVHGAAAFLKYAASRGVEIFYITNRDEKERASTLKNLSRFNLPNADDAHFLPKETTSSKESRRQKVSANFEIIMLLGDNLGDFSSLFDKKQLDIRSQNTNISARDFGSRFIVLPNPVYGDWESSFYKFNKFTQKQKDSVIRADVKTY